MIVLQGSEDEIVPPEQSEMIVAALREKGIAVAYLLFDGEQHGFRRSESIISALEAELAFFGRVLGFEPADELPPIEIANL
jgi:dipeptidyl aminopeptidase/acylaminoacyl peptidase